MNQVITVFLPFEMEIFILGHCIFNFIFTFIEIQGKKFALRLRGDFILDFSAILNC